MEPEQQIVFGPFRFDRTTQHLWQGQREIRLRAKTLGYCNTCWSIPDASLHARSSRRTCGSGRM